jgi:hypothetical protein
LKAVTTKVDLFQTAMSYMIRKAPAWDPTESKAKSANAWAKSFERRLRDAQQIFSDRAMFALFLPLRRVPSCLLFLLQLNL